MGMSRGRVGYVQGEGRWVCPGEGDGYVQGEGGGYSRPYGIPPLLLTPSGGHQNTHGWQVGGTHPTGMLSCYMLHTDTYTTNFVVDS